MVGDDECTPWSEWTECSKTCGHGTHSRTRKCSNPGPNIERKDCPRNEKQDKSCADNTCGKYNSLEKYFVKLLLQGLLSLFWYIIKIFRARLQLEKLLWRETESCMLRYMQRCSSSIL